MRFVDVVVVSCAGAFALIGCGQDPSERAKLSVLQKEVFTPSCAQSGCHGGANPVEGMNLSEGKLLESTLNVDSKLQTGTKRIVPGDAANSLVYQVVKGVATDVQQMPPGFKLRDDDVEAIRIWIENGASAD